ncbi:autotransporter domain-containing protein [Endozoicomonas sp. 8E]|uniref:autotransporter family protein n=1 Tax=Endozoicomonas sp. 8E TaxID=3035692 RepID=UPI0029390931|nr:autotransporter domain-containing protein [Endozoicomonas sp. 8E]WOG27783.1 autotransporter domain-containing protein [Endozoicomonas sp. 8E]
MNKSLFRKKSLVAVIAATVPFAATQSSAVTEVTSDGDSYAASGLLGAVTRNVNADATDDYAFILDADTGTFYVQGSALQPVNINLDNPDGKAVLLYRQANSSYAISLPSFGGLYGKGTAHGILLSNGEASVVQINVGDTNLGGTIQVEDGDAFRIEEELSGIVTITGTLQGNTAITAAEGGKLGTNASILVNGGVLKTNGDTSIDFSGAGGALVIGVVDGTVEGKVLGYTGPGDILTIGGNSTFGGDIEDVESITVVRSDSYVTSFRGDIKKNSGATHVKIYGIASFDKPGAQTIDGDLTVYSTGVITTEMDTDTTTNAALIVTGTANIESGSTLKIVPTLEVVESGNTIEDAKIIEANTNLNASDLTIEHSVLIDTPEVTQNGNALTTDLTPRTLEALKNLIAQEGAGATTEEALAATMTVITRDPTNSTSFNNFYKTVSNITDVKKLAEFARESKFNNSDAVQMTNVTAETKVKTNVLAHVRAVQEDDLSDTGLSYGGSYTNQGFWLQVLGSDVTQDDRRNDGGDKLFGFDADLSGLTLGAETTINDDYLVGAAFTLANAEINKHDSNDNSTIKNYQVSLYGSWEQDNWFLDGVINIGRSNNERSRYIDGFVDAPITSDYISHQYGLTTMLGMNQSFGEMKIVPMVGFNYTMVKSKAFKEDDKYATGFALDVDSQKYQKVELGAGVEISQAFRVDQGELEPSLKLMAWHDFKGDVVETTTRYVLGGPEFTSKGADAVKNSYQASASVTYRRNDNMSFVVGYELNQSSDYKAQNYYLRMKYDF